MMTIGERIKQRRIELGLSADDLAVALGKNRATIYRYESSEIEKLPTSVLEPLARALHTTPAYLMGWTEEALDTAETSSDASKIDDVYLSFARDAQDQGINPEDIMLAIETIKNMRKKKKP